MRAYRSEGPITETTGEAVAAFRLVKRSGATIVYADAGDEPIGITTDVAAITKQVAVRLLKGTVEKVTAGATISNGAAIYVAADGKVSSSVNGKQIGQALMAASGDGSIIAALMWGPRGGNDMLSGTKANYIEYFDDFFEYNTTFNWAVVEDAGASAPDALTDAAGGVLSIGCDGDIEDECYVSSISEIFKFQTDKNLFFQTRIKLTEANTDDANWIIGLSDTVAADSLQEAGAGPMASYDGSLFFKVLDGTGIQFETSNAGTQVTNATFGTWASATWFTLGYMYSYNDGVTGKITPYVDGVAGTVHSITISGLEEMHILMGVKAGGANEEALLVDYVHVVMDR